MIREISADLGFCNLLSLLFYIRKEKPNSLDVFDFIYIFFGQSVIHSGGSFFSKMLTMAKPETLLPSNSV
jgi:hypothetical protein